MAGRSSPAEVMDPELYKAGWKPTIGQSIKLATLIPDADAIHQDVIGRLGLDLIGIRHLDGQKLGTGWQGDILEVVEHPQGLATVWSIRFATEEQASETANGLHAWAAKTGAADVEIRVEGNQMTLFRGIPAASREDVALASRQAFVAA
jgi:hypothetical protein